MSKSQAKFSPQAACKAAGLYRVPAYGGVHTLYQKYRQVQFSGTVKQVQAVKRACKAAGFTPATSYGQDTFYLGDGRAVLLTRNSVCCRTPKSARSTGSIYD